MDDRLEAVGGEARADRSLNGCGNFSGRDLVAEGFWGTVQDPRSGLEGKERLLIRGTGWYLVWRFSVSFAAAATIITGPSSILLTWCTPVCTVRICSAADGDVTANRTSLGKFFGNE
ncbi:MULTISPECIES: hypothetical protein [Acidithiobacillus]|uniref:Uncharacterized protein n=3 Tax=Acidithiobacillus TaxID=119977 RepID=A0A2W1K6D6_ACIFR|nr:hypothetical protein [Acidithiobacillus ferrooxidans]MCR1343979.1 hypothetical protein [Acidithiobacillus ferrooxidans]PZD82359.1 hypothetical protein DN052_04900 [Acidithiobacillus ferrooxidans]QLK41365.1 hypothetical protein FE661_03660 [Acidithiobacillus ferrooxidans]QZT53306.1 hypothetical protein K7B00_03655 [Acidithiobacillus ferrooxidans]RRN86652.1 MAG: hypothetical protein EC577_03030 [Acidithiobacillus ferrooxidans]